MEININLLPPYKREEIDKAKRLRLALRIEIAIFLFILVFLAYLGGLISILNLNFEIASKVSEGSKEKTQYEKIKKFDDQFKKINSDISQITKIKKDQLYWSNMLVHFSQSVFSGISIQNLATKDYAIYLVGKADSRDNLIAFKDKLEKDGCFSDINLPLSNLVSKGDIDFQMDLKIKEDCVRPVK